MKSREDPSPQVVWLNGRFLPLREAAVSPLDRGFLYGDGIFETMRAENGVVLYLDQHLTRAGHSLESLRIKAELPPHLGAVFSELLHHNDLMHEVAVAKIVISRGMGASLGLPLPLQPTVCLTAQKYTPPDPSIYDRGWRLEIFSQGFAPPLAAHKTLNYLYFLVARQAAVDAGANESVILDHLGKVTETSAGSLIARSTDGWWTPHSPYQLPGITIGELSTILHEAGFNVQRRPTVPEDLLAATTIWVMNSLMGIMPVSHVGDHPVPNVASEEASLLREHLFARGRS